MAAQYSTVTSLIYLDDSFQGEFHQTLLQMQAKEQLTDVLIRVGGRTFPCHKLVLCAVSAFFRGMLLNEFKESTSSEVDLQGIDQPSVFASLIDYMYTGKIQIDINNAQDLVQSADLLQLLQLKGKCMEFLLDQVEASNCIALHRFAMLYTLKDLEEKAQEIMLREFQDVMGTPAFLGLTQSEMTEYLSDDRLEVQSEDVVFEALVAWAHAGTEDRTDSFKNLAPCVRFPLCSGDFLYEVVRQESLMLDVSCQRFLIDAVFYILAPERRPELVQPRICQKKGLLPKLVLMGGNQVDGRCWVLEGEASPSASWRVLTELPAKWCWVGACVTNKGIAVTGGYDDQGIARKECWLLEWNEKQWTPLPPMAQARCVHASLCYGEAVFVMGGSGGGRRLDSVEKLKLNASAWSQVAPMKKAVQQLMVTMCQDRMFAIGGLDEHGSWSRCTQEYDAEQQEWSLKADMPEACEGGAASVGGRVLVVGGSNRCCMRYDPSTDAWTRLSGPLERHLNAPALAWRGKVLVGGGVGSTSLEEYDPEQDKWTKWNLPMPAQLAWHWMLSVCFGGCM